MNRQRSLMHRHPRHWMDDDHLQFTGCVVRAKLPIAQSGGDREWLSPWTRVHCPWRPLGAWPSVRRAFWTARKRLAACVRVCASVRARLPLGLFEGPWTWTLTWTWSDTTGRKMHANGRGQPQPVAAHRPASRKGRGRKKKQTKSRADQQPAAGISE